MRKPRPLPQYEPYRRMALGLTENPVARWWRYNRWTLLLAAGAVYMALQAFMGQYQARLLAESQAYLMAEAMKSSPYTGTAPQAFFVVGASPVAVDKLLIDIAQKSFEMKQALKAAKQVSP